MKQPFSIHKLKRRFVTSCYASFMISSLVISNIFSPNSNSVAFAPNGKNELRTEIVAAAKCVFEGDSRTAAEAQVNCPDFGVTATLKPHQIEGLSWLIRRYLIGVNVILVAFAPDGKNELRTEIVAAAKCVFEGDARTAAEAQVNCPDFGVTATLKPHQIEGLSWLIRRYLIGVNVILGMRFILSNRFSFSID
ncbi:hypothetical protein L2E82_10962 [Cichorium intybus]|uniref:Uncharacterized protein n=1 Tax=Cichorium intybus TaxID=13427 RepID=A0ACB9GBX3_CICIN|nr:hypothetical protein L2E82_10962 [Cichorium intybus]